MPTSTRRVSGRVRRFLSAALLALAAMPAQAWDDWEAHDKALFAGFGVLSVADAMQTAEIVDHPDWDEGNPLLGRHPSDKRIVGYFLARAALYYVVADALPAGWRTAFLGLEFYWAVEQVYANHELGIRVRF